MRRACHAKISYCLVPPCRPVSLALPESVQPGGASSLAVPTAGRPDGATSTASLVVQRYILRMAAAGHQRVAVTARISSALLIDSVACPCLR
jgi:hypothetical protein